LLSIYVWAFGDASIEIEFTILAFFIVLFFVWGIGQNEIAVVMDEPPY